MEDIALKLVMVAIFLLVAFPVHEFAHAWAAYMQGDATAKLFGRLTLNPIVHFDRMGGTLTAISIFFSPLLFGWAKPTPVNPSNFKDRRNGDVIVAMAGPASNVVMALLGAALYRLLDMLNIGTPDIVALGIFYFVLFNVVLAIFNLVPIPPLDGSALLFRFLSPSQAWQLRPILDQYGFIILIAVVLLGGRFISSFIGNVTLFLVGR